MIKRTQNDNTLVEFGRGIIRITSAYIDEKGVLTLNTHEHMPVGESAPLLGTIDEKLQDIQNSEVRITFDNIKSLEVLILKLQEVRAMMLGCDIALVEEWKKNNNITAIYQPNPIIDGIALRRDGGYVYPEKGDTSLKDESSTLPSMFNIFDGD